MRFLLYSGLLTYCFLLLHSNQVLALEATSLLTEFSYPYKNAPRKVPVKIYYPTDTNTKDIPIIILSHGLGGTREIGTYLGDTWAQNGFVVVAIQHDGSDRGIFLGKKRSEYMRTLKAAISIESYLKRVEDVTATIDQITQWNEDKSHPLYGMININKIGMSGHSFGAITTQVTSGQWSPITGQKFTDKRIKAAFVMSPSIPNIKGKPSPEAAKKAFAKVEIPWLLMTGTRDHSTITPEVDVTTRTKVYENLPLGDKYQLILDGATHMSFSDRTPSRPKHRNPDHHIAIKTISTAFFQAYLNNGVGAEKAKEWLKSDAVKGVLSKSDSWEKK